MRRGFLVSLALLVLAGCAGPSLRSRMAAYIGADEQTLVQQLGVPDKQITVNGIQYFAYNQQRQVIAGTYGYYGPYWGPGPMYGGGFYPWNGVMVYACETTFMLRDGRVFTFTMRGDGCDY